MDWRNNMGKVKVFIPMNSLVLVKLDKAKDVSEGGIILPDDAKKIPNTGTVISVGSNVEILEEGDRIFFSKYVGTYIILENKEERLLIQESDVLGYWEEQ